ncbi:hypothetical protein ES702_07789 [subsurface metagenome]
MDIIQACSDKRFFLPSFRDISSWENWMIFLKILYGLPLEDRRSKRFFKKHTGLRSLPNKQARECYVVAGRRSGKSFISAIIAVYQSAFHNWNQYLSAGEKAFFYVIAVDRDQARTVKNYVSGVLHSTPSLEKMVLKDTTWEVELTNNTVIKIMTCGYRGIRGRFLIGAVCEEIAFWRDEFSANPATEILRALRPGMIRIPNSLLLAISTPYSQSGLLFETYTEHFGATSDDSPLIFKADSKTMNPTIPRSEIVREYRRDATAARSEFGAEFRQDLEQFLSLERLEAVIIPHRYELPPVEGVKYYAFIDSSSGILDSFALGISHRDERTGRILLDCNREIKPPFKPSSAIKELADVIKSYGVSFVVGDKFALGFVREMFQDNSIMFQSSELTTSENFLNFLPLVSNLNCEILDDKRLIFQLRSLERRTGRFGKDQVSHPPGQHDDLAIAAVGSCLLASEASKGDLADITLKVMEKREDEFLTPEEKFDRQVMGMFLGDAKVETDSPPESQNNPSLGKSRTCFTLREWLKKEGK